MSTLNRGDNVLSQDDGTEDANDQLGLGQPISQAEIDDVLYGEDRPTEERIERLREFRDVLAQREAGDFGDEDPKSLIGEIDSAISRLAGLEESDEDAGEDYSPLDPTLARDPSDHLETLSPDDDERLDIEDELEDEDPDLFDDEDDEESKL